MKGWQALAITLPTWIISRGFIEYFSWPLDFLGFASGIIIVCAVVFLYDNTDEREGEE